MLPLFAVYAQGIQEWSDVPGCLEGPNNIPTLKCLEVVFGNIIFMASAFVIIVLFIMFVVGAFRYLTSLGNPEKVKSAQGTFRFAIIGLVLFLSAFLILKTIDVLFLGNCGRIFKFEIKYDGTPFDPCT